MFDLWEPVANKRGMVVFAASCPRDAGCTAGSWWKWNGDPAWLRAQTTRVGAMHAVDPARTWIVGWSGGGTYLGWRTPEIERDYAAIVIDGGGARPALDVCAATPSAVYFLGGDRNPFHELTEGLHAYYATVCPHPDLSWTVLKGADHPAERIAMATHRESILEWLSMRRRAPGRS
jgi:poly(3-hydroxybutyrate) depolymerase